MTAGTLSETDVTALLDRMGALRREVARVIVGQDQAIEELLLTFLAGGHSLLDNGHHDLERATSAQGARGHTKEVSMVDVVLMA